MQLSKTAIQLLLRISTERVTIGGLNPTEFMAMFDLKHSELIVTDYQTMVISVTEKGLRKLEEVNDGHTV